MPFTPYQSTFDPETLRALQEAFDMALSEAVTVPGVIHGQMIRDLIAKRIIAAARENGERNPVRLKHYALKELRPSCFL